MTSVATGNGTEHIRSAIQRASSSSRAPMSSTYRRRTSSPLGPASCSANALNTFTVVWQRVDRPRVDKNERTWYRRVAGASSTPIIPPRLWPTTTGLSIPTSAQNRARSSARSGMRVAALRAVAPAATAQVERRDSMRPSEVVELRPERRAVAAPAMNEQQLRIAATGPLVVEPQTVEFRVRHDAAVQVALTVMHQTPRLRELASLARELVGDKANSVVDETILRLPLECPPRVDRLRPWDRTRSWSSVRRPR